MDGRAISSDFSGEAGGRTREREKCELLISWPLFPISVSFLLLSTARTPDWNAARRTAVVGAFAKRPWTWRRRIGPSVLIHLFQLNWHLLLILFLSLPTNNTKSTFSLPFWPSTPVLSLTHSTELEYAAFLHRVHFRMPSSSVGEKKRTSRYRAPFSNRRRRRVGDKSLRASLSVWRPDGRLFFPP